MLTGKLLMLSTLLVVYCLCGTRGYWRKLTLRWIDSLSLVIGKEWRMVLSDPELEFMVLPLIL